MGEILPHSQQYAVLLFLTQKNEQTFFLQFKVPTGQKWAIPRHPMVPGNTSVSESLPKYFDLQQITGWKFSEEIAPGSLPYESSEIPVRIGVVELPQITTSLCVVQVEDGVSCVPKKYAKMMRWRSFLSIERPEFLRDSSESDKEIVRAWLHNQTTVETARLALEENS